MTEEGGPPSPLSPLSPTPPKTPAWVKVLGVVLLAVVAGFALLHLSGMAPTGH